MTHRAPRLAAGTAAILANVSCLLAAASPAGDPTIGRRTYRDGVLADGRPLAGRTSGDVVLQGRAAACSTCHRPSGYGGVEGRTWVPPITARWLFEPAEPRRVDRFRRLFQDELDFASLARLRSTGDRPAYTRQTLAVALTEGHAPTGRSFDPLMPRYALGAEDLDHLAAYLETLSAAPPAGVTPREIRFATVIAGEVPEARRRAMLEVMAAFVHFENADTERRAARPPDPLGHEEDLASARRLWTLDVWEVHGPAAGWRGELEARHRERPVFALLGGLGDESWEPVHAFCEEHGVPCLFPETELPVAEPPGESSFYLSAGLALEARVLARHLVEVWPTLGAGRLVQVYRDEPRGTVPAAALRSALAGTEIEVADAVVGEGEPLPGAAWGAAPGGHPAVAVLWPGEKDLLAGGAVAEIAAQSVRLYAPASAARDAVASWPRALRAKAFLVDRFAGAEREPPHAARVRAWLRARGIAPLPEERLQLSTYFTLSLAEAAVAQMLDSFSRELFVENVEREAERTPNPGLYPRLALGPGQRLASKGARIVRLGLGDPPRLEEMTSWIVP